jgi:gluconate kinase
MSRECRLEQQSHLDPDDKKDFIQCLTKQLQSWSATEGIVTCAIYRRTARHRLHGEPSFHLTSEIEVVAYP